MKLTWPGDFKLCRHRAGACAASLLLPALLSAPAAIVVNIAQVFGPWVEQTLLVVARNHPIGEFVDAVGEGDN